MKKKEALKLWNGDASFMRMSVSPKSKLWKDVKFNGTVRGYVAAYSRADARRVIAEYTGSEPSDSYIRDYWSCGHWGNSMKGIEVERGLWLQFGFNGYPVRVV